MAAIFNLIACVIMFLSPRYMMGSYPKAILKAAVQPQTNREKHIGAGVMCIACILLLLYGAVSASHTGQSAFRTLFLMGYTEWMMASLTDFILLDIVLFQTMKQHIVIPGTEDHPGYELKNWMVKLALPEHFLLWPFIVAPLLAVIQAGISLLFL
ncbi:MAG: hypothetical protein PHE47_02715 [Oscillospiraceae bacterium]|nr:hypothetical protein [Oscillospiraceae bacterium]